MHITHFYAEKKITLHRDQQIKERGIQHNKILSLMSSRFCCKYAYAYPFCYNERCNSFRPRNSLFPLLSKEKSKGENPLKKISSFFFFFFPFTWTSEWSFVESSTENGFFGDEDKKFATTYEARHTDTLLSCSLPLNVEWWNWVPQSYLHISIN